MYFEDGDLYSDGKTRRRVFKWKNIDESSQADLFHNQISDDEHVEDDIPSHESLQKRIERHERETFLMEKMASFDLLWLINFLVLMHQRT